MAFEDLSLKFRISGKSKHMVTFYEACEVFQIPWSAVLEVNIIWAYNLKQGDLLTKEMIEATECPEYTWKIGAFLHDGRWIGHEEYRVMMGLSYQGFRSRQKKHGQRNGVRLNDAMQADTKRKWERQTA